MDQAPEPEYDMQNILPASGQGDIMSLRHQDN
jgi:hypothetical protein